MSPEAQRIAIAEALGWVWYRMPGHPDDARRHRCLFLPAVHEYEGQSPRWLIRADGTESIANMAYMAKEGMVPDYLNNLNAMAQAEDTLLNEQRRTYVELLIAVHPLHYDFRTSDDSRMAAYMIVSATAAQRAEAFLRTLGRWVDNKG